MDVKFINPFVKSICNTFQTMCSLPVSIGKPAIKTDREPQSDVSGVIGFSGDATGAVVLHFSFDSASRIASAFAGDEITPDHEDFADAIGELANMVAGGAKAHFEGLSIQISLPSVVCGKDHSMPASRSTPRLVIPCDTDAGAFSVEVGMIMGRQPGRKGAATAAGVSA